jgi:arginine decarboxylase
VENGQQVVSANYVTPYPPGYPVLVPGQVFSPQILAFMRSLDTPEIHGYRPDLGYRVLTDKALEIAAPTEAEPPPLPEVRAARGKSKGSDEASEPTGRTHQPAVPEGG